MERADHQRHDADRPPAFVEVLQEDDLQLDRMFRQVGQLVVEQAVAVMPDQSVDVFLIGRHDAEGRLEVLAGQREAVVAIVRGADDDEQLGVAALEDLLEAPGESMAAAGVVDVGNEGRAEPAVGSRFAGQAGAARVSEQSP